MERFTYESQGANTYLVYEIMTEDVLDTMSLGMLTNNKIGGFAPTFFTQMDATKYVKYNVSSKVSVKQFFSGAVNKKRLVGVFSGIIEGLLSAEEYMIDPSSIVLDLDYIFADVSTCEALLICLPIVGSGRNNGDLCAFFKNIMFTTQFDQTENCDHVAKIINFLNSSQMLSLKDFKELLDSLNAISISVKNAKQEYPEQPKVETPMREVQQTVVQSPVAQPQVVIQSSVQAKVTDVPVMITPPMTGGNVIQPTVPEKVEKKMSMMHLLAHYSKENAEIYKAQKAAAKEKQAKDSVVKEKGKKQNEKKQKKSSGKVNNSMPNFAIPGQAAPAPTSVQPTQASAQQVQQPEPTQQAQAVMQSQMQMTAEPQQFAGVPQQGAQGQSLNFGETTVLRVGGIGETTVLRAAQNVNQSINPHLIRMKNGEKILIDKPVFRIGKEKSYVDYFMGDNTAISRSHANIVRREDEFFVMDTNSTNHTFLNGNMLQSMVEVKIKHGDTIRLSNEDFEFKLY